MKNSLRIHKWTHNEFNIFILGVLTHPLLFIVNVMPLIVRFAGRIGMVRGRPHPEWQRGAQCPPPEWQNNGCLNFLKHKAIAEGIMLANFNN